MTIDQAATCGTYYTRRANTVANDINMAAVVDLVLAVACQQRRDINKSDLSHSLIIINLDITYPASEKIDKDYFSTCKYLQ